MPGRKLLTLVALQLVVLALPSSSKPAGPRPAARLAFASRLPARGLWGEALFRFQQAGEMDSQNARAWNTLAVAQEATGRFEEALASYKRALEIEPGNAAIKRNYARFVEFYQSFKPRPTQQPAAAEAKPQGRDES